MAKMIDASDERSEGKWKFGYSELEITNWLSGQPDNRFDLENHAAIESNTSSASAEWSDETNSIHTYLLELLQMTL